jgi:hypothetical protein
MAFSFSLNIWYKQSLICILVSLKSYKSLQNKEINPNISLKIPPYIFPMIYMIFLKHFLYSLFLISAKLKNINVTYQLIIKINSFLDLLKFIL